MFGIVSNGTAKLMVELQWFSLDIIHLSTNARNFAKQREHSSWDRACKATRRRGREVLSTANRICLSATGVDGGLDAAEWLFALPASEQHLPERQHHQLRESFKISIVGM